MIYHQNIINLYLIIEMCIICYKRTRLAMGQEWPIHIDMNKIKYNHIPDRHLK